MEKQPTIKQLSKATNLPSSCFTKLGKDGYGTDRPNSYAIWYRELAKAWNIQDEAPSGYSYQYPNEFWQKANEMIKMMESKGFRVVDPIIGSHVHGYFSRKIYFK